MDISGFYREWNGGVGWCIKTLGHPALKSSDSPELYQSIQQQCTSNIIAKIMHIALHIERQIKHTLERAVRHVERTYNLS